MTESGKVVMQQALAALERVSRVDDDCDILAPSLAGAVTDSIEALRNALAQPTEPALDAQEVEPVAYFDVGVNLSVGAIRYAVHQGPPLKSGDKLYLAAPQERKPLTDDQITSIWLGTHEAWDRGNGLIDASHIFAHAIIAAINAKGVV